MKGLRKYIRKHGKHFTEELAYKIAGKRWNAQQIEHAIQKKVYYNVTESTIGDMVYMVNEVYSIKHRHTSLRECAKYTIGIVGDYQYYGGILFMEWLKEMKTADNDFDFRDYI